MSGASNNFAKYAKQSVQGDTNLVETPIRTLKVLIEKKSNDIANILGGDVFKIEKFKSNVIRLFSSTDLKECDPMSVLGAAMQAAYLNLDLDPNLGQAYVLARWNNKLRKKEATFQTGYQGLLELCRRSGRLLKIESHIVWENEKYEYYFDDEKGTVIKHFPLPPSLRGEKRLAVYFIAHLTNDSASIHVPICHKEWIWAEEVEIIKKESLSKIKDEYQKYSPWQTSVITEDAMWKKTSIRRGAKFLPKTIELDKVLSLETEIEKGNEVDYSTVVDGKEPLIIDHTVNKLEVPIVYEQTAAPQQKETTQQQTQTPKATIQKLSTYKQPVAQAQTVVQDDMDYVEQGQETLFDGFETQEQVTTTTVAYFDPFKTKTPVKQTLF